MRRYLSLAHNPAPQSEAADRKVLLNKSPTVSPVPARAAHIVGEPLLADVMRDPIIALLMQRDGVDAQAMEVLLADARSKRRTAQ